MDKRMQIVKSLLALSVLVAVAGCAPQSTAAPALPAPTPTLFPGWEHYSRDPAAQCGYVIDHPADLEGAGQGTYSWILNRTTTDSAEPFPNFIYVSVIPNNLESPEPGAIYNYDAGQVQTLLSMPVGEMRSLREDPNLASSFTYTRLPDVTLGGQAAQAYENTQPWEFPPSTKEIRYTLQADGCTFLVGGYLSTVGTGQPGAIDEDLFRQIIETFRLH
jgi:hypothetical protein